MGEELRATVCPTALQQEVADRFGLLPNFFQLGPDTPEITGNLWGFAKFGYLDNPLPSSFKERLFVYLSQFCDVRYCISRHVGFLVGLGRPAGDRDCPPETIEEVVRLIRRPLPRGRELDPYLEFCRSCEAPLDTFPDAESFAEEALFACCSHVFLQNEDAARSLEVLRYACGETNLQYLLVFLTFVRTAHFWTKVHPELQHERDISELLNVQEALAKCVLDDSTKSDGETAQVLVRELIELRKEREQAELLRVTLSCIGDAVVVTDEKGRVTSLNPVAEQLTGWSGHDAHGKPVQEIFRIVNEQTREEEANPAVTALREGCVVALANHTVLLARDGRELPIDDSASPIRNTDGAVVGCVLVFRDATQRRDSELRIRHSEERYRALGTATSQIVWTTNPDGHTIEDSPSWRAYTGQTFEQWKGLGWLNAIHPEDRERTAEVWSRAVRDKSIYTIEYRVLRHDGKVRWMSVRGVPVLGDDGTVREWIGANTDITALKRAESEAAERTRLVAVRADVSTSLVLREETSTALQSCCEALVEHLGVAFARIWTMDQPEGDLVLKASAGQYTHLDGPHSRVQYGALKIGRIAATQQPHLTNDVPNDPNVSDAEWAAEQGMVSFAGYPLLAEGQVRGVIAMFGREAFSDVVFSGLVPLAEQVAQFLQRKEADAALRESELRYRMVGQAANDAIWDWDLATNKVTWNEGVQVRFGYSEMQVGEDATWWTEHIHPDDRQRVMDSIHAVIGGSDDRWLEEYRFQRADGSFASLLDRGRVLRDEQGKPIRMVGSMLDLTEKLEIERELQEARSRLDSTLSAAEVGTWEFDPINDVVRADLNLARMFGMSVDDSNGQPLSAFLGSIHPDDRQRVITAVEESLEGGNTYETEYRLAVGDSGVRWVIARGRVERDAAGQAVRMPGVVVDITERKQFEEALLDSEERLHLALEAAELGTWNIDPSSVQLTTDERFRIIFQGQDQPISYEEAVAALHPDDRQRVIDAIAAATSPTDPTTYAEEYRVIHPSGDIRWVYAKGRASFEDGERGRRVTSFDGTLMDVTEQRRMREELQEIAAKLAEADRRKDVFLATLAHELRNPLAPIRTGLELLRLSKDDPNASEATRQVMERQTMQLIALVDDLLDVSRITRGNLNLRRARVRLDEVVRSAVEASTPLIEEANHRLTVTLPNTPTWLDVDPNRMAQVFSNLLTNAARYTPPGGSIELTCTIGDGEVVGSVKDSGIGIPADLQQQVFDMFDQGGRTVENGHAGLGIGLTLVKTLVEMHAGTVEVESEGAGAGSEFRIRLPLPADYADAENERDCEADIEELPTDFGFRVLVVDDNRGAAHLLSVLCQKFGNDVRKASDGLQAVEEAAHFRPQVVLMDMHMPVLDGCEAARRIRTEPWGKTITLVAVTGNGQEVDRQRSKAAGFDKHLVKPIGAADLQQLFLSI